jgi:hypothetical protein
MTAATSAPRSANIVAIASMSSPGTLKMSSTSGPQPSRLSGMPWAEVPPKVTPW